MTEPTAGPDAGAQFRALDVLIALGRPATPVAEPSPPSPEAPRPGATDHERSASSRPRAVDLRSRLGTAIRTWRSRRGVFVGEPGHGLAADLQRNEYVRYARAVSRRRQAPVLSGTGTLFRTSALREVARERDRLLPGIRGEYYNSQTVTEDNEITLALKTLGHCCLPGPGCVTTTEVMPTFRDLYRQRMRWQTGALSDLRRYGLTRVTFMYWVRQAALYAGFSASLICWAIMSWAMTAHLHINVGWTFAILGINLVERLWTVRKVGLKGTVLSALVLPEFGYDVFRMIVFFRALVAELRQRQIAWNHLQR